MKKSKILIILTIIGTLIILGGCEEKNKNNENITENSVEIKTTEETETTEETKAEEQVKENYYVDTQTGKSHLRVGGGVAFGDGREMYYESINTDYYPQEGESEVEQGFKIIALSINAVNNSTGDWGVSTVNFSCYADGYSADAYFGGGDEIGGVVSTGRKIKGNVYFKVPIGARKIEVEYSDRGQIVVFDTDDRTETWMSHITYYREDGLGFMIYPIDLDRFYLSFGDGNKIDVRDVETIIIGDGTEAIHKGEGECQLKLKLSEDRNTITIEQEGELKYCEGIDFSGTYVGFSEIPE